MFAQTPPGVRRLYAVDEFLGRTAVTNVDNPKEEYVMRGNFLFHEPTGRKVGHIINGAVYIDDKITDMVYHKDEGSESFSISGTKTINEILAGR